MESKESLTNNLDCVGLIGLNINDPQSFYLDIFFDVHGVEIPHFIDGTQWACCLRTGLRDTLKSIL